MTDTIQMTRGASISIGLTWLKKKTVPPAAPDPIDLTLYDIELIFLHPALEGQILPSLVEAVAGKWAALVTWQDDMPIGRVMHFTARLTPKAGNPGLLPITSRRIWLEVLE